MAVTTVLKNNYQLNSDFYAPKVPFGHTNKYYPPIEPILDADHTFGNLVLSVFECNGNEIIVGVTALKQVDFGQSYQIYWDDLVITTLNGGKFYRFAIYDDSDDSVVFVGNLFEFVLDSSPFVKVSFRHTSNIFNVQYENIPNFTNIVWLDLNLIDNPSDYEITTYPEKTSGFMRNEETIVRDVVVLESFQFDRDMHDAMKLISGHDTIKLNDRKYQVKEGYKYDFNRRSGVSRGTIELWDQEFNETNYNNAR